MAQRDSTPSTSNHSPRPLQLSSRPYLITGGFGTEPGQLKHIVGAACDDDGNVYVLDSGNKKILRYGPRGEHIGNWLYGTAVAHDSSKEQPFIQGDGAPGTIAFIAYSQDKLYVSDGTRVWSRHVRTGESEVVTLQRTDRPVQAFSVSPTGIIVVGHPTGPTASAFRPDGEPILSFQAPEFEQRRCQVSHLFHDGIGRVWVVRKRQNALYCLDPATGHVVASVQNKRFGRVINAVVADDDLLWIKGERSEPIFRVTQQGKPVDTVPITDPREGLQPGISRLLWNTISQTLVELDQESMTIKWWPTGREVQQVVDVSYATPERPARLVPDHMTLQWTDDPKTTATVTWRTAVEAETTVAHVQKVSNGQRDTPSAASDIDPHRSAGQTVTGTSKVIMTNRGRLRTHRVHFTNLSPDSVYAYRVGSGNADEWSPVYTFRTAPSHDRPVRIGIIGEIHEGGMSHRAAADTVAALDPDFVLNTGDVVTHGSNQAQWDDWFHYVGDLPARAPHIIAMGNHDTHYGTVSTYYRRQLGLHRKNGCPGLEGTVYSFDYGPLHVVVLSESDPIDKQTKWLEEDLKRNTQPWTIVNIHVPPFTSKAERIHNELKGTFVPLFTKYGVDLIVSGHDKSYMRTFPMRDEQPLPPETKGAPIYVIVVSGEQFYPIADLPWIHVAHKDETMYSVVDVDRHQLHYTATTIKGEVIDTFTLTK